MSDKNVWTEAKRLQLWDGQDQAERLVAMDVIMSELERIATDVKCAYPTGKYGPTREAMDMFIALATEKGFSRVSDYSVELFLGWYKFTAYGLFFD